MGNKTGKLENSLRMSQMERNLLSRIAFISIKSREF